MTRTVLITGASSGFGKDAALLFSRNGWNVAASMRAPEAAESWATPAGIFTPRLDVNDAASIEAAVAATLEKFGNIDVLINNAGYGLVGPIEGASATELRRQFDTNVLGLIATTQAVLPDMRKAGSGVIVNLSSMGGRLTIPLYAAYHSTKFAVEGLTEAMQYELAPHGIRVKLVEPGGSRTNFSGASMTRTTHPAYAAMVSGLEKMFEPVELRLPGPEKVVEMIFRAATDGSRRLRYPVIAAQFLLTRQLVGERGWRAMMDMAVRRAIKVGNRAGQRASPDYTGRERPA